MRWLLPINYSKAKLMLALQQLFPIQIHLTFPTFKLLSYFIFQCYRPQTRQLYLFFPALSISGIHKV